MLPTNVMSFMKKMVATDENTPRADTPENNTGTFGKLKQTLSTSLLTAQDKVNKMSPRPSMVPESESANVASEFAANQQQQQQQQQKLQQSTTGGGNKQSSGGEPGKPPSRTGACRVCLKSFKPDDYSKTCFECQQRVCEDCASYSKLDEHEDATTWRCSVCRRKMASRVCIPQDSTDSMLDVPIMEALVRRHSDAKLGSTTTLGPGNGVSLAPPRSPELRRHSDVSPASLKELEKLKGGGKTPSGTDSEWRKGRSAAPSRSNSPPRRSDFDGPPPRGGSRRSSRCMARQHSYDDDIKSAANADGAANPGDLGLGIPSPMPRRASAYDVFAPGVLAQVAQSAAASSASAAGGGGPMPRRSSFRVPPPSDDSPTKDGSPSSDMGSPVLTVAEEPRTRRRGSQLPDIAALQNRGAIPAPLLNPTPYHAPALEDLEAPRRQTSLDGEAIKIVIHDVDSGPICASKRRVVLRRDPTDKAHRTRGFGMRVVGGKTGADGRLFAYIVWTVPGGPAEKGGLQQGDKILEWNGMSLIDRSFEEVCAIMDRTGDVVDLLVEHATDFRMCDLLDDNQPPAPSAGQGPRKSGDGAIGLGLVPDTESTEKSPSSPTRRKLPKTPEQIIREKTVSGRIQVQVWYHGGERNELVVSLMAADDLSPRDDSLGHGSLPEAYAKVRISPKTGDGHVAQTEISAPAQNPIWNATLTFADVKGEDLMDRYLEIELWDLIPQIDAMFLGECMVEIQKAFLDDRAVWYRLEDPKQLRASGMRQPSASPRGSIATGCGTGGIDVNRLMRSRDYAIHRSVSDDVDSLGDGASLLHPDHAWIGGSRRGSSQSETLEVEVYQLGKDFSHSLPGSRRSSFQDREENNKQESAVCGDMTPPATNYRDRRRSSCIRRDPDDIMRSLKAVKGELGRTMSLSATTNERRHSTSRRSSRVRKESIAAVPELSGTSHVHPAKSSPQLDLLAQFDRTSLSTGGGGTLANSLKWRGSVGNCMQANSNFPMKSAASMKEIPSATSLSGVTKLGPGQIHPKGCRLNMPGRYGELKIGFLLLKGVLEIEIDKARNFLPIDCDTAPDTYVKCYIKDGERLKHKKKTRVARHSLEPNYKQCLKYQCTEIYGRTIVIMVWQKGIGFDHNQGIGGAEISVEDLCLRQQSLAWYPLFPMHSIGSDSNDSP